jgi:hypothetical protein
MPTFQITLSVPFTQVSRYVPTLEDGTVCYKMLAYKLQMPVNHPEESTQHSEHGQSLKLRIYNITENNRSCLSLNEVWVHMVNGETHGRNCGLNGCTSPVFIEKYENHSKCMKIVPSDEPFCRPAVSAKRYFLTHLSFSCLQSIILHVLPIKHSAFTQPQQAGLFILSMCW